MSLGIVTEHLINLIVKQVNDNGLVVWYDPDGEYVVVKAGHRGGIPGSVLVSASGTATRYRDEG